MSTGFNVSEDTISLRGNLIVAVTERYWYVYDFSSFSSCSLHQINAILHHIARVHHYIDIHPYDEKIKEMEH